jgi:hypothetical protein
MFNIAHPHLLRESCAAVLVENTEGFNLDAYFQIDPPSQCPSNLKDRYFLPSFDERADLDVRSRTALKRYARGHRDI